MGGNDTDDDPQAPALATDNEAEGSGAAGNLMQNMQVMPYTLSFDICLALDLLYTTSCVVCQAPAICTPHHVYSPVLCWHPVCTGGAMAPFFVDQHWLQDLSVMACLERCTLSCHAAVEVLKTVKSSLRVYPAITVLLHMPKWHKKQKHWHPLKVPRGMLKQELLSAIHHA